LPGLLQQGQTGRVEMETNLTSKYTVETEKGGRPMQWEMVLLLIIASPFALYHLMRYGIRRLKKTPTDN
jgi:hypothetical protein